VPLTVKVGLKPGREIHDAVGRLHTNITQVARTVPCGYVHGAAEGDSEMGEVPAHAGAIVEAFYGRSRGAGMFIAKANMGVDIVTNGLHPGPASGGVAK